MTAFEKLATIASGSVRHGSRCDRTRRIGAIARQVGAHRNNRNPFAVPRIEDIGDERKRGAKKDR
jgi:hypothetical protein